MKFDTNLQCGYPFFFFSKKRKFKVEKTQIIKRRRADKSPTEDANIMDTGLSLRDDEELALRLLSSR